MVSLEVLSLSAMSSNSEYTCGGDIASCSCHSKLLEALQKHFGFSSFRPGQMEASCSILHGKDVFVHMATRPLGPFTKSDQAIGVIISRLQVGVVVYRY